MPLRAYRFSRPAPSATRTPIQRTRRLDAKTPRRPGKTSGVQANRAVLPSPAMASSPVTYASYLKLDELLSLQQPGPEHDEMLFIIVHQVYELWFKELLHELDYLMSLLRADDGARAAHTFKRILTVLKVLVAQIDILETITPLEFLSFRDRLEAGSGFQSRQFRELECVLGIRRPDMRERYPEVRYRAPGLWDAMLACLARRGYAVPSDLLQRDPTGPIEPSPALQ